MITYRLSLLPDNLQGRVNSVFRMIYYIGATLGVALAGLLLEKFDTTMTILIFSISLLILALVAVFNRNLRNTRLSNSAATTADLPPPRSSGEQGGNLF